MFQTVEKYFCCVIWIAPLTRIYIFKKLHLVYLFYLFLKLKVLKLLENGNGQYILVCKIIKIGLQQNDLYKMFETFADNPRTCICLNFKAIIDYKDPSFVLV